MAISFEEKQKTMTEVKYQVALELWDKFIKKNENPRIWIDAGSSAEKVAEVIGEKYEPDKGQAPTIATNNLGAWSKLQDQDIYDIYIVGGRYNKTLNAIIELQSFQSALAQWNPNIIIIAVSGINKDGLYCSNVQDESPVKNELVKKYVEQRIIIADHTKIGNTDFGRFLGLKEVNENCDHVFLVTNKYDIKSLPYDQRGKYTDTMEAFKEICGNKSVIEVKISSVDMIECEGQNVCSREKNGKKD